MSETPSNDDDYDPIDALAQATTTIVDTILEHAKGLPEKQRFALLMTLIMTLSDKLMRSHPDPAFTYLTTLHSLVDVYRNVVGEAPPDRTLQ